MTDLNFPISESSSSGLVVWQKVVTDLILFNVLSHIIISTGIHVAAECKARQLTSLCANCVLIS